MSIESVLLSNHLISTPFSFGFQSSPTSGSFPMSWLFASGDLSIGASTSASVLPKNIQLISFRVDWFDLHAVQGTLKSLPQHHNLKASVLQHSASLTVHLSHPYVITSKTIALTIGTFVCFSIRCLGWSQLFFQGVSLLISWLQVTVGSDFGAQENKLSLLPEGSAATSGKKREGQLEVSSIRTLVGPVIACECK